MVRSHAIPFSDPCARHPHPRAPTRYIPLARQAGAEGMPAGAIAERLQAQLAQTTVRSGSSGQSAYSSRTLIWQTPSQTRAATFRGEVQRFRGQAVIADQFHNHAGGQGNGKIDDQSHATGAAGIGPALLGADPFGNGVPIPSREGAEAVPYARGHESGCA